MPERLMRQRADHAVARRALTAAKTTPPVDSARNRAAGQHRTVRLELLSDHLQPQLVEAVERTQIGAHGGNVSRVRLFRIRFA